MGKINRGNVLLLLWAPKEKLACDSDLLVRGIFGSVARNGAEGGGDSDPQGTFGHE
ncbi:MAG: hypothetical protein KJ804_21610 [Proteobacteria bacterium]|nr:hypothetical protein [Pseudomonadota bacterium]MBU1060907.1 hypothetical protein [Pseudomonadota bacterium]